MLEGDPNRHSREQSDPAECAEQKLLTLLVASFNHSQGDGGLQRYLFEYLHRFHAPETDLSDECIQQVGAAAIQFAYKLFHLDQAGESTTYGHMVVTREQIVETIRSELDEFQEAFYESYGRFSVGHPTDGGLLKILAEAIVGQDYKWTVTAAAGRPRRRLAGHRTMGQENHWTDSYYSYVVEHALKGRRTELAELDALYASLGEMYRRALTSPNSQEVLSGEAYGNLEAVIEQYNQTHPEGFATE